MQVLPQVVLVEVNLTKNRPPYYALAYIIHYAQGGDAAKGQKGEIGATGDKGATGAGDKGQKGDTGSQGTAGSTGIPSGFIGLWSGAANAIPSGWFLCNGSNGTPDLRGRFVVGYSNTDNDYDVGDTGGSATDTVTISGSDTVTFLVLIL